MYMKKARLIAVFALVAFVSISLSAQQNQPKGQESKDKYSLADPNLDQEGKSRDAEIKDLGDKIQGVIQKNKMMENKDIRILPYQTDYELSNDNIYIERHMFLRDAIGAKIIGERRKSVKIFVSGGSITRIDSRIYERDYEAATEQIVEMSDPTPLTESTDDITIKQYFQKKLVLDTKLGSVKNTTAFPVRTDMKRDFYIPHLQYFYNTILSIAETYSKGAKDSDSSVLEFLLKASSY
jgi:hypothetical protein